MGRKYKKIRRKKPKTKSEELTYPRLGQITRAGMIIRPKVPRKDVEYLQVPVAAQEDQNVTKVSFCTLPQVSYLFPERLRV